MLSFVIIGKNEGWKLEKSILSVLHTIEQNKLEKTEILYIDSRSTDGSVENIKKYNEVKIIILNEDMNAAIARNVGAKIANGDILFFIDGDMEIASEFLPLVYSEDEGLCRDFVSGNWMNFFYDRDNNFLSKEKFLELKKDLIEKTTGGLFLIKKKVWDAVGGMDVKFRRSQDIDLGLRLAKRGIFLLRKKEIAANHHTIAYLNEKRMWKDFFSWNHLYGYSLLYRKHMFNKHMYARLFRNDYTLISLILIIILFFISMKFSFVFFLCYLVLVVLKSRFIIQKIAYYLLRDLSVLIGFFVFHPKQKFIVKYKIQ